MATNNHMQLVRDFYDAVSRRDHQRALGFFATDAVYHDLSLDEKYRGHDSIRGMMEEWFRAFPDLKLEVRNVVGAGEEWAA
jgi:ketosteroid isomerase-like protein